MTNPIKEIYAYNKERGLLDAGYSDTRECAFPIEEALEGFDLSALSNLLKPREVTLSPKLISRELIKVATWNSEPSIEPVDQLDKHLDILVYTFGSIFKMGLNVQDTMKALSIVTQANARKSNQVDSAGKNIKGDSFIPPEVELQKLLDKVLVP